MVMQKLWIFAICLLTAAEISVTLSTIGNVLNNNTVPESSDRLRTIQKSSESLPSTVRSSVNKNPVVSNPSEIKQGKVGEKIIIMEFEQSLVLFHRLYHNDQLIASIWDSSCDVSTKSPFYCRLRCSMDGNTNKTRIEINNVTENESGLYKLCSDGKEIKQSFLNITGNVLKRDAVPKSSDELNSSQTNSESLQSTVRSSSTNDPVISNLGTRSDLFQIVLPVTVTFVMIMQLIGCMIWIHRRNADSIELVARIVLEKMETISSTTPSTLRRCPHTLPREEGRTSHSIFQPVTVENSIVRPQFPASPKHTNSVYKAYSKTSEKLDDNCQLEVTDNISNLWESNILAGEKFLDVYHKGTGFLRGGCTSSSAVCSSAESNTHRDSPVSEAAEKGQEARGKLDTYAEVKKVPKSSSKNNMFYPIVTAGVLCKDGYETVDLSPFDNSITAFQDVEIAPSRLEPPSHLFRVYNDEEALCIGEEEQEEEITIFDIDYND